MSSNRRKFTDEFKADAVQLVVRGDRPIAQVARELEINESSLGYWVKAYRAQHPDPQTAPPPVEAARIARLEAENRRLAEEIGYPTLTTHTFRKTAATILGAEGMAAVEVAAFLGHANPSVTQDVYMNTLEGGSRPRYQDCCECAD